MTRKNTDLREKGRAAFLAAIMVMSMVAMGATGIAGVAVADATDITVDNDPAGEAEIDVGIGPDDNQAAIVIDADDSDSYDGGTDIFERETGLDEDDDVIFTVDVSGLDPGTYDVYAQAGDEVNEPDDGNELTQWGQEEEIDGVDVSEANYDVTDVDAPAGVVVDSPFDVTYTVENIGDVEGEQDVDLDVDPGTEDADEDVVIGPGDEAEGTLTGEAFGPGSVNITVSTDDTEEMVTAESSEDTATIVGVVEGTDREIIQDSGDVRLRITALEEDTEELGTDQRLVTEITLSDLNDPTFVEDNSFVESASFDEEDLEAGEKAEYDITLATFGDTEYELFAEPADGLEDQFNARAGTINLGPDTTGDQAIRLQRLITTDELTADPAAETVDVEATAETTVTAETEDEAPIGDLGPHENTDINTDVVEFEDPNGEVVMDDVEIDPDTGVTDEDGEVDFEVSLDLSGVDPEDDLDEDIGATIEFESDGETAEFDVTFEAQPPTGQGTIAGDVRKIDGDIQLGADEFTADSNSEPAEGVNVHAVRTDRVWENTVTVDVDQNTVYRVVDNETDRPLDVRADYLFTSDTADVFQNETAFTGDTGFEVGDQSDAGTVNIHVLEDGEYYIQEYNEDSDQFEDGPVSEATTDNPLEADNDLTFDGIEERFDDVEDSVVTDVTNEDGEYMLTNLFTQGDEGQSYVVIAGGGDVDTDGTNTGFANAGGYQVVGLDQNADIGNPAQADLAVQDFQIDVQFDFDLEVFLENEQGQQVKFDRIENDEETDVVVDVTAINQETGAEVDDVDDQDIELDLIDTSDGELGSLADTELTAEDGEARTTYEAPGLATGFVNVSATTENEFGQTFSTTAGDGEGPPDLNTEGDQAEIEVFDTVEITGDVVNENDQNIPNTDVTLFETDEDGNLAGEVRFTQSGDDGSYVFTGVETGQSYAITAVALDADGNEVENTRELNEGEPVQTALGGEDIVITGADPGETAEQFTVEFYAQNFGDNPDVVESEGLLEAIDDWRADTIESDTLLDVIDAWRDA